MVSMIVVASVEQLQEIQNYDTIAELAGQVIVVVQKVQQMLMIYTLCTTDATATLGV
jgi:hypothetical protein